MTTAAVLLLVVSLGALGLTQLQQARANAPGPVADPQAALDRIESILRDARKDADSRISEALKVLEESRQGNGMAAPSLADPFADPTLPLGSPFGPGWDPFREMERMRRQMDRMFGDAMSRMHGGSTIVVPSPAAPQAWAPQGEFEETEDAYIYRFDLPGVDRSMVNIIVENRRLIIEGRRVSRVEESRDGGPVRREIQHGQFRRVSALPPDADANGAIESKLENGVLTITLPKLKNAGRPPARRIDVM